MNKWIFFLITLMIIMCFIVAGKATDKETIKIKLGTLATAESAWGKIFKRMNAELMEKSDGQLRFILYFGQDEGDLIDKMRKGRCHAVSLTATGLGQVLSESFIFQLPMLFETYDELDYVRRELTPQFSKMFDDKGYVLLGWGDLGFIYLFSKKSIKTWADLKNTRLWVWNIDPITKDFVIEAGITPVTRPIQSVLPSLENDDIQTVYAPPHACIALGWHTQVEYMSDLPPALSEKIDWTLLLISPFAFVIV